MPNRMTKKGSGNIESVRANGGYKVPGPVQSPPPKSGMETDALTKKGSGTFSVERSSGGYKVPQPK